MTIKAWEQPVDSERQRVSVVTADAALPRPVLLLCAIACGLAVAGITYAQPMLDMIADEFRIDHASAGIIVTMAQVGYALGLIFIVPLGDLLNRRRLILGQSVLAALALLAVALAPSPTLLVAGMAGVGSLAVVIQVIVAYAAIRAAPAERGRVVGLVTSGVVGGILLARTGTGMLADLSGWRTVYMASATATLIVAALLFCALPCEERQHQPTPYAGLVSSLLHLIKSEFDFAQQGSLGATRLRGLYVARDPARSAPLSSTTLPLARCDRPLRVVGPGRDAGSDDCRSTVRSRRWPKGHCAKPFHHAGCMAPHCVSAGLVLEPGARNSGDGLRAPVRACHQSKRHLPPPSRGTEPYRCRLHAVLFHRLRQRSGCVDLHVCARRLAGGLSSRCDLQHVRHCLLGHDQARKMRTDP